MKILNNPDKSLCKSMISISAETNFSLYQKLIEEFPAIDLIASGGVSDLADVYKLEAIGVKKVVVGKVLLEEKISWRELEVFYAS